VRGGGNEERERKPMKYDVIGEKEKGGGSLIEKKVKEEWKSDFSFLLGFEMEPR
jgi:hypothetical protein